jgi:hypothetical protein
MFSHQTIALLCVILVLLVIYLQSSQHPLSQQKKEQFKEYKVMGLNKEKSINVLKMPSKAELKKQIRQTKVFTPDDADLLGSFLEVERGVEMTPKDLSFINIDAAVSDNIYAHVKRTQVEMLSERDVRDRFQSCMADRTNTVKGCLTYSQAGLYPGLCRRLAGSIYGQLSTYTGKICNQLMTQQRNSCYAGAC